MLFEGAPCAHQDLAAEPLQALADGCEKARWGRYVLAGGMFIVG